MDDVDAEEKFSQQLSQLSIEEENPRITRLMDMFTVPLLPPPGVRHDQGQIISSHSSLTSVEYTQYIIERRLEKEAKEEVAREKKLDVEERKRTKLERLAADRLENDRIKVAKEQKLEEDKIEKERIKAAKIQRQEEVELQKTLAKEAKERLKAEKLAAKMLKPEKSRKGKDVNNVSSEVVNKAYRISIKFAMEHCLAAPSPPPNL